MQLAHPTARRPSVARNPRSQTTSVTCQAAIAEINAYIAIRDELLAEAERLRTPAKVASVSVANDYLLSCLRPARSAYQAQCLPESMAARERQRCESVRGRLAQLRMPAAA